MKLKLTRTNKNDRYTEGRLYINDVYFCDTIEPAYLSDIKPRAIQEGTYNIIMNYSNRFQTILPLLCNVPDFVGVRIHAGNTAKDTEGCILVGYKLTAGTIINSRKTLNELLSRMKKENEISITIE